MHSSRESTAASSLCRSLQLIRKTVNDKGQSMNAGGRESTGITICCIQLLSSHAPLRRPCRLSRHRRPPYHSPLRRVCRPFHARQHPARRPLPGPIHFLTAGAPPFAVILANIDALGFSVTDGYGDTEIDSFDVSCASKGEQWDGLPAEERANIERQGVKTAIMVAADIIEGESGERVARNGATVGDPMKAPLFCLFPYLASRSCKRRRHSTASSQPPLMLSRGPAAYASTYRPKFQILIFEK